MFVGSIPNLWPENLGAMEQITPKSILSRQAMVITEKSQNRVRGEVTTKSLGRDFMHTFQLVAPALDHYQHFIIRVRHGIETMYPVRVYVSENDDTGRECSDEEGFFALLRELLNEERTRDTVRSLIAQGE